MTTTNPERVPILGKIAPDVFRRIVLGGTLATSLALYGYEIVRHNPAESFAMLRQFGPSFLLTLVAIVLIWDLAKVGVCNVGRLADSMQTLSTAVATIAAKDDRQAEEMQLIVQFNAQTTERLLAEMKNQGEQLKGIAERLDRMGAAGGH